MDLEPFVRLATDADEGAIERHIESSRIESQKYRGRVLELDGTAGERACLVAGFGDTVWGSAVMTRRSPTEWFVVHLWVDPSAREVGLGDTLMAACIQHARRTGGERIRGSAQPGDRATKNLFERHGLVAETIVAALDL